MSATRYPVYVISKGRHDRCLTAKFLIEDRVPFKIVIEPQERALYAERYGEERLLILPFSNLGQGSIPARNWVWEHSIGAGAARHWILDDNMAMVRRWWKGKRLRCEAGPAFRCVEDFTDRYENIGISGLNYTMFAITSGAKMRRKPFSLNVHVYSCMLIRNDMTYRWRGRYNEDTDLCLQVLSGGLCTALIIAFMVDKIRTMTMKGGNSDDLYKGDGRLKMSRSLERMWPYVVETKRRWDRPQHHIRYDWSRFTTPLIRRKDIDWKALEGTTNEYGIMLQQVKPVIKSERVQKLLADSQPKLADPEKS